MKLHVGRLRLRLPAAYAGRAESVARAVAQASAQVRPPASCSVDSLALGTLRVQAGASDGEIGAAVARQLSRQLDGRS